MIALAAALLLQAAEPAADAQRLVDQGSPGAVVMVVDHGEPLISVAGVRAEGSDAQIELTDLWHLGSNTKAMTAVLVARLVEQGVVEWDDTVAEWLGDRVETIRPDYADATFADLMHHRSGIIANPGPITSLQLMGTDAGRDVMADRLRYAAAVLDHDPGAAPGEFLYSNAGYTVAGTMLEAATGESWETLLVREVFTPLGIEHAGFGPPGSTRQVDQPRGHSTSLFGGLNDVPPTARADNPPAMGPAGRVHMAMQDYALWLEAVMAGARGEGDPDFLSPESWNILLTPPEGGNYAMGWGVTDEGAVLRHAGSNTMWFVQAVLWPEADRAAVAGVNDGRLDRVAPRVGEVVQGYAPE
ncbi:MULTISPECIES: serine hydrolase domain-containing protein [Hyphobacterium]|uniref:Serine hydrolase domain-containing protein n=1 Tax=Hyphobacterium vulgare TaxID=1736751 RepID=A0ABV6ZWQ5_9PROT